MPKNEHSDADDACADCICTHCKDRDTGAYAPSCPEDPEATEAAAGFCPGDFIEEDGLGEDDNPLPPELMEEIDEVLSPSFQWELLNAVEYAVVNTLLERIKCYKE